MPTKLDKAFIDKAAAKDGAERTIYWDVAQPSFGLCVTRNGAKSFVYQYRVNGQSRRMVLAGALLQYQAAQEEKRTGKPQRVISRTPLAAARHEAQQAQAYVGNGIDPLALIRSIRAPVDMGLEATAREYLKREGKRMKPRSLAEREAVFRRYVFDAFGKRPIGDIKRSEIARLLDRVEDNNGATASQHTLVALRALFNWHAKRDDTFHSPIVAGMARIRTKEQSRDRILTDDEIRAVWDGAEAVGYPYGRMLQWILLTATRLNEAARANEAEFRHGLWTIPGARYKTGLDHVIPLSAPALQMSSAMPTIGDAGWRFTTTGASPISGFSKYKAAFDKRVIIPHWTTHDLRRTARSLMSRAGVHEDHAERAVGHVITGVRGTYDRHAYLTEKRLAFARLSEILSEIIEAANGNHP